VHQHHHFELPATRYELFLVACSQHCRIECCLMMQHQGCWAVMMLQVLCTTPGAGTDAALWVQPLMGGQASQPGMFKQSEDSQHTHLASHRAKTSLGPASIPLPALAGVPTACSGSPCRGWVAQLAQGQRTTAMTDPSCSSLRASDESRRPCQLSSTPTSQPPGSPHRSST